MALVPVDLPSPADLRGGWAARAAVLAAIGWWEGGWATDDDWYYDDSGGNWAAIRFQEGDRAVLIGNDHEFSQTYFRGREGFPVVDVEETDLLSGAPDWWSKSLEVGTRYEPPYPNTLERKVDILERNLWVGFIGFIYGWDGQIWQRVAYEANDGFDQVGLLESCADPEMEELRDCVEGYGLADEFDRTAAAALVAADGHVTEAHVEALIPGWDSAAGAEAARCFLRRPSAP